MLSFLIGLGLLILIPLFVIAVIFDICMFALALGWKVTKLSFKVLFAVLGAIGAAITAPILVGILILLL